MRTISLTELASKENIQISEIFAIHQYWREGNETFVMNHPRRQSSIVGSKYSVVCGHLSEHPSNLDIYFLIFVSF